jgi:hypothetical protein
MMFLQIPSPPWRLIGAAASWHVSSQHHARRNALVGSTELARRRQERLDVEEYLAVHEARSQSPVTVAGVGRTA